MRLDRIPLVLLAFATVAAPVASAHSIAYPSTPISPHTSPAPTFWYGTYGPGHITPGGGGVATISIFDASGFPVGGFVCQDRDADAVCGSGPGELQVLFCNLVTIVDLANAGQWDPTFDLFVYADPFGCPVLSVWTTGWITHT